MFGLQNKFPAYSYSLRNILLATGIITFILVVFSTFSLLQSRRNQHDFDYFHSPSSDSNPLLTVQGVDQLIQEHSYPRLAELADFKGLGELCKSAKSQHHVYLTCRHNVGGLMNVRNMILNCVRYAIEAGAYGLIFPQLEARDPVEIVLVKTGQYKRMEFLFDEGWFRKVLEENCPQMKLFDHIDDVPRSGYATMPDVLTIQTLMGQPLGGANGNLRNKKPHEFRSRFDAWLKTNKRRPSPSVPTIVRLDERTLFSFAPTLDPPAVMNNFGFLLDFRLDLSGLANIIVDRLREDVKKAGGSEYLALHLRREADVAVQKEKWATFDELANKSLSVAAADNINLLYVASGDIESVDELKVKAAKSGVRVVDKHDMLSEHEKEFLNTFAFDQQAIVDYLVLMHSNVFIGSGLSSFSSHLISRREYLANITLTTGDHKYPTVERDELVGPKGRLGYWDMDWP
ncbi:hypothetical protein TWF694_003617 [Orbilia ellipsospora]|uniref:O-fucosyltransferase family protein n=1 Tax=Orbilia ellipsospora TaxID=2528407 RepID=A0AAV9WZW0_9PEZI